jgi:hypothetical protein
MPRRAQLVHKRQKNHCIHKKCANGIVKGGVCWRNHGAKSLATSPREVICPPKTIEGSNATTAAAIAREEGGIGKRDPQTNTAACQTPSLHPSATALHHSNEEQFGAWIYKSWEKFY